MLLRERYAAEVPEIKKRLVESRALLVKQRRSLPGYVLKRIDQANRDVAFLLEWNEVVEDRLKEKEEPKS